MSIIPKEVIERLNEPMKPLDELMHFWSRYLKQVFGDDVWTLDVVKFRHARICEAVYRSSVGYGAAFTDLCRLIDRSDLI